MSIYLMIILAVMCNVGAQVAMKLNASNDAGGSILGSLFSIPIAAALCLYAFSFVLTSKVMARSEISTVGPVMAGATFVAVFFVGNVFFGEGISLRKIVGILLIVLGIVALTYGFEHLGDNAAKS